MVRQRKTPNVDLTHVHTQRGTHTYTERENKLSPQSFSQGHLKNKYKFFSLLWEDPNPYSQFIGMEKTSIPCKCC